METIKPDNRLGVTLEGPIADMTGFRKIRISNKEADFLDISLRRTIRISDRSRAEYVKYAVPPDCGSFPIFSIDHHKHTLPQHMAAKGGVFIPIYQREAMWIHFESTRPFAVKVSVNGINAVTGEPDSESIAANLRRTALLYEGKSVQDYIVTGPNGGQKFLDGVLKKGGNVAQFVATPCGRGYSAEYNLTGEDEICGLQIEIMPQKLDKPKLKRMSINVRPVWTNKIISLNVPVNCTIQTLKEMIQSLTGIPIHELLITINGHYTYGYNKLSSYGVESGSYLYLLFDMDVETISDLAQDFMGRVQARKRLLEAAAAAEDIDKRKTKRHYSIEGKYIEQVVVEDFVSSADWDTENTAGFNIQMLNVEVFRDMTGMKPPRTTVSEATYRDYHCEFLAEYANGHQYKEDDNEDEDVVWSHEVSLDKSGTRAEFIPVGERTAKLRSSIIVNN
ncbi:hypothetical protein NHQ30_008154 [Ciborinia camelliae]|nr:hypothetical protein NHQ30_008154 [Ciborinia camelliae]